MPLKQYIEDLPEDWRKGYIEDVERECALAGIAADCFTAEGVCRTVIELAFHSKANLVIIPMNDVLAQGKEARMNLPSTVSDKNWSWRFIKQDFKVNVGKSLLRLAKDTGRA